MNSIPFDTSIFEVAVDQAYDSVVITTADLDKPGPEIVYVNDAFCKKTGYTREELMGKTPRMLQGQLTDRVVLKRLRKDLKAGRRFEGSTINYTKTGEAYVVQWSVSPLRDKQGKIVNFLSIQRDMTHEMELEQFNQRILESLGEGVFGIDMEGNFTFINPAALSILGYQSDAALIGQNSHDLTHAVYPDGTEYPLEECPIHKVMMSGKPLKNWRDHFIAKNNELVPVEVSATPIRFDTGGIDGGVVVFRDISTQLALEQELENAATHDPLTGAYNRRYCDRLLSHEIKRLTRHAGQFSIFIVDIDYFKKINDTFGHLAGDDVLKQLTVLIEQRIRETDSLARWGGEEFLVVLPNTPLEGAVKLAKSVRESVEQTAFSRDLSKVTVSVGVGQYHQSEDRSSLISRVDKALYQAKTSGRNRVEVAQ